MSLRRKKDRREEHDDNNEQQRRRPKKKAFETIPPVVQHDLTPESYVLFSLRFLRDDEPGRGRNASDKQRCKAGQYPGHESIHVTVVFEQHARTLRL